jgi:RNA polymerase sigma factor (sigma-70 family)
VDSNGNGGSKGAEARGDESALMRALAGGDENALSTLYASHAPMVFAIATRSLDRAAAEEIVQDVFLALWRHASSFDPALGSVRGWLSTIAQRRVANELRRRSRRPKLEAESDDPAQVPIDPAPEPAVREWLEFRRAAVRDAVRELPPEQRQALGLAFFEELTHEQVAEVLELRLGTAKTRIRAGIAKLRARLTPIAALLAIAIGGLALSLVWQRSEQMRDERALAMLTSSDMVPLRLEGPSGGESDTHATWRARPGDPTAVLTLSHFPDPPAGAVYQAWTVHGRVMTSIGTLRPGPDGHARLVAENPAFAIAPEGLEITVEPAGGSVSPTGPVVVAWPKR